MIVCPSCGLPTESGWSTCHNCGKPITGAAASAANVLPPRIAEVVEPTIAKAQPNAGAFAGGSTGTSPGAPRQNPRQQKPKRSCVGRVFRFAFFLALIWWGFTHLFPALSSLGGVLGDPNYVPADLVNWFKTLSPFN